MTATAIQPAKVYALVVGIEKYQAGSAYDLNGPANDALQFSSWLLDQGVEPEHIYLFLSPLEQNQGVQSRAEAKGLTPAPATHDRITSNIRSQLTNESSRGDLLYVFWGGHGIITKTDATVRRLFFEDTDDNTKWNLNVNSLVEALSTAAHGAGFPQQIFLIDACANTFYQGLAQTIQGEASGIAFASSGDVERGEQFVLFASAAYEVATNDSHVGTGRFSQAVLEDLKGQPLLPDMKALVERLQDDFLKHQKVQPAYWIKRGSNQIEGVAGKTTEISNLKPKLKIDPLLINSELSYSPLPQCAYINLKVDSANTEELFLKLTANFGERENRHGNKPVIITIKKGKLKIEAQGIKLDNPTLTEGFPNSFCTVNFQGHNFEPEWIFRTSKPLPFLRGNIKEQKLIELREVSAKWHIEATFRVYEPDIIIEIIDDRILGWGSDMFRSILIAKLRKNLRKDFSPHLCKAVLSYG